MTRIESTSTARVGNVAQPEEFDLVILGGGTGSTVAAWTFAGEGKRVAVVERKYIGVEGLIPLFSSAASAHQIAETRGAQISAA
jgi:pyruvate/2-oxoglutarate dehydrogenase complex dihydrolipoamide dehydrogenase (E3) component